jgi:hypothetical protein
VQGKPNQYYPDTSLAWTMWAPEGTTAIKGINAVLNIIYSFIGHPLIPSYIGDMRDPSQFPTALYITMAIEIVLFTILGGAYRYRGGMRANRKASVYRHRIDCQSGLWKSDRTLGQSCGRLGSPNDCKLRRVPFQTLRY